MTIYFKDDGRYDFPFPVEEQLEKLVAFVTNKLKWP